ncbi:seed maturation protein PM30 [Sesbania bispinosa]|nr:seed maturation protein PM30 [Sesbania bispinosa]
MTGQAKEKASEMGQSTKESAQSGKDNTGGFLQQTGEKVKDMAQGATEAVKQTLGMGQKDDPTHQRREY